MRFICHVEALRRESFAQLVCDSVLDCLRAHCRNRSTAISVRQWTIERGFAMSRLEAFWIALS
jgi:hypothetical protein